MTKWHFFDFFEVLCHGNLVVGPYIDVFIHNRHKFNFLSLKYPIIPRIVDTGLQKSEIFGIQQSQKSQNFQVLTWLDAQTTIHRPNGLENINK